MHPENQPHIKYRPDIDGLRAVAVLAVVVFHAFPKSMPGGFIGVDIFFVISGYLISTIIFNSLDEGKFSLAEFYTRRIKRIFPALIAVLLVCLSFGWFALLDEEYRQLGKHIAAGASFASNLVLWGEAGYFDNSADTKPLLHLWSLGIEEQFYIIWPILLWASWRCRLNLIFIILCGVLLSFYLNLKGITKDATATFYSPQTRFWELIVGSLLAWALLYKRGLVNSVKNRLTNACSINLPKIKFDFPNRAINDALSIFGGALIIYGLYKIKPDSAFPGSLALIPTLGAALIIFSGPNGWLNKQILSNKIFVWFGLISFPLYLWHWPLLSFARIIEGGELHRTPRQIIILVSILLAWLTFKFIERPLRFKNKSPITIKILIFAMLTIGIFGFVIYQMDGFKFRSNSVLKDQLKGDIGHLSYHRFISDTFPVCTPSSIAAKAGDWEGINRCVQSKSGVDIDVVLLGDSHAEHLFLGAAKYLPNTNIALYAQGGLPILSNPVFSDIFEAINSNKSIYSVLISAHWIVRYADIPPNTSLDKELLATIDVLIKSGKRVSVIDDIPVFPSKPVFCKGARWPRSLQGRKCNMALSDAERQRSTYALAFDKIKYLRPDVTFISPANYLCNDQFCSMSRDNSVLYRDDNHLNLIGSSYVGQRIAEDYPAIFTPIK